MMPRAALLVLGVFASLAGCDGDSGLDPTVANSTTTLAPPSTSSTAPKSTTTSTSTTTSSTTTSLLGTTVSTSGSTTTSYTTTTTDSCFPVPVDIVFSVTNGETLGALQYDTDYSGTSGYFDGRGPYVECSKTSPGFGGFAAFNDQDDESRLSSAFATIGEFTGPGDIAVCVFIPCGAVTADDFVITIVDQSRPDLSPANATVGVRVVSPYGIVTLTATPASWPDGQPIETVP